MGEIWLKVWVTEGHSKRIAVVEHRHELRSAWLRRTSVVEESDVIVVVDVIHDPGARSEVQHLVVVGVSVGRIVRDRRHETETYLGGEFLVLEEQVGPDILGDVLVDNAVGVSIVDGLSAAVVAQRAFADRVSLPGVVGRLFRRRPVPAIGVVPLDIEMVADRLCVCEVTEDR